LLHDGLGQTLSAMGLHADMLSDACAARFLPEPLQRHALSMHELTQRAMEQVRGALVELRPPMLEEHGLVAALHNRLHARGHDAPNMELKLLASPAVQALRWPAQVEYAFFMVATEAMNNAILHADAHCVECIVEGAPSWLRLVLRDDGCGIPDNPQRPGHLGVVGMRERAMAVGAQLDLKGRPGQGTVVELEWESEEDGTDLPG
jgi:signal transduction histidine kinase